MRFNNIPKFSSSGYHFSHASGLSVLIILNLFFHLKLNHDFLFHLARHHQQKLIVIIVTLILKVSPGKFFLQCAQQLHMLTFCIYKRFSFGEKKCFSITCTQKWTRKKNKNRKANEISNYWNIKLRKLFKMIMWSKKYM